MANYKEADISGKSWIRCANIVIENPHASTGLPVYATFREEVVLDLGNGDYSITPYIRPVMSGPVPRRTLWVSIDPATTFDLYDPVTGQKTGTTMTHAELYAIMYSAYRTEAEKSDAAIEAANTTANT